jgi:Predicted integral membrane protein
MLRQLSRATGTLAVAAAFALPTLALAQSDNRPVVVVFRFDNNSIGAGRTDFDGMATGVQDLLITDLASNSKIRLVDRTHLNEILTEQNLSKTGQVDAATAVRLGKILGAQYAVTGGFLSDGKGSAVLTARTIDIETTQIANPQKIMGKTDDILGLINQVTTAVSSHMNLATKPGVTRHSETGESSSKPAPAQAGHPSTPAAKPASAQAELYRKPLSKPEAMKVKLDVPTMKLYSNALDELDRNNTTKARQLFQQVLDKYPGFEPAQRNLQELSRASN